MNRRSFLATVAAGAVAVAHPHVLPRSATRPVPKPLHWAGAHGTGAPRSGRFARGDWVFDHRGRMYVCTRSGTPGRWAEMNPMVLAGDVVVGGAA